MSSLVNAVTTVLFAPESKAYAVVDGSSCPGLLGALERMQPEHVCLFRGELEPGMAEAAPYLVALEPDDTFTPWVVQQGWGKHWGVFVTGAVDFRAMRKHCRTFLIVHGPEGKPLYFRYYDPRVLRDYLPSCTAAELATLFGPVHSYVLEDESPTTLRRFQLVDGKLDGERVPVPAK